MRIRPKINVSMLDINGVTVKIQSKHDEEAVNGWAVIAYTPNMSLRSKACHRPDMVEAYAHAIAIACGYGPWELDKSIAEQDLERLQLSVKQLTPSYIPEL
tara:strand:- start:62 stop:364 length:303 start_codon:yes stop_codon:yes gene_type:complete